MNMMKKPTKPCYCGANDWWQRADGGWNCSQCHPNPNPSSEPAPIEGGYSAEALALRDRVRLGNKKLFDAWQQLKGIFGDKEQWTVGLERWSQANEKLSLLCTELKALGYTDCLYLDETGKKIKKCLPPGDDLGCRVCPSSRKYSEEELMEL